MKFKPGEIVPQSGIYEELDALGIWVTDVTCLRGGFFPPTEADGFYYILKMAALQKLKET